MIFLIIAFFLIIYSLEDFKRGLYLYLIFKLFLNQNINIINIPGIPLLTVDLVMNAYFIFQFSRLNGGLKWLKIRSFPLRKAFLINIISVLLSCVFSLAGFGNSITMGVGMIISNFIFVWMLWFCIGDIKDIKRLTKYLTIAFVFICSYAFLEKAIGENPLINYEISLNKNGDASKIIEWQYLDDSRNVGGRIQSVFFHPIGSGGVFALMFIFFTFMYMQYRRLMPKQTYMFAYVIICSFICVWFSNSRGPLIFLICGSMALVNFKNKSFYGMVILAVFLFVLLFDYISPYLDNIFSLFDTKAQQRVGGSDISMRLMQLDAAFTIFLEHPWFGNGIKSLEYIPNQTQVSNLLGLESCWFRLLVQQGILGIISFIYLITSLFKSGCGSTKKTVVFLTAAYLIFNTVTSIPGFLNYLFYMVIFILIKLSTINNFSKTT